MAVRKLPFLRVTNVLTLNHNNSSPNSLSKCATNGSVGQISSVASRRDFTRRENDNLFTCSVGNLNGTWRAVTHGRPRAFPKLRTPPIGLRERSLSRIAVIHILLKSPRPSRCQNRLGSGHFQCWRNWFPLHSRNGRCHERHRGEN